MKVVAHLSDLHFGREDPRVVEGLLAELEALRPDLVAVSGDLTQRARDEQFRAARAFLSRLRAPTLVVPGNHDVPLWHVPLRFSGPLVGYTRHVTAELSPSYEDDELLVLGVSTARSLTFSSGRISRDQIEYLRRAFCARPDARLRVLVAHHPFTLRAGRPGRVAGRAWLALEALAQCGLDLLLTGHLHRGGHHDAREHFERLSRSVLALHAGSATSDRLRGEPNSYNRIVVSGRRVDVAVRAWDGRAFRDEASARYEHAADGWRRADDAPGESAAPPAGVDTLEI